jgi:ribose transport system permease protein
MSCAYQFEPQATPEKSEVQRLDRRLMLVQYAPFAVLIILITVMTAANPSFLSRYNLQTISDLTATLMVIALGQTFVIMLGSIDLSVGAIASLVSVVFAICIAKIGYWAYPVAIAVGALAGAINGIIFTKMKIPSFITTLGTLGLFQSVAYVLANGAPVQIKYSMLGMLDVVSGTTLGISNLYLLSAVVFAISVIIHRYTKLGRTISAVGNAERAAWICGVDISKVKLCAMLLSGLCAGISGIFLACQLFSGTPSLGMPYQLQSIASVAIGGTALTGGVGGPARTLVGVLVISFLSNGMNVVGVNIYAQQIVTGFVVVAAVGLTLDRSKVPVIK